jgi:putative membrane protein
MWWGHGGWGTGDWVAMSLMMALLWSGLIALVTWLIRSARDERLARPPVRTPDELLSERFAKGEVDEDEFTRRRELLHSRPPCT